MTTTTDTRPGEDQQPVARVKRSSKYWGQTAPNAWFDVRIVHDTYYQLRGKDQRLALADELDARWSRDDFPVSFRELNLILAALRRSAPDVEREALEQLHGKEVQRSIDLEIECDRLRKALASLTWPGTEGEKVYSCPCGQGTEPCPGSDGTPICVYPPESSEAITASESAKPGLLDTNPALFNILNDALGTMHYHRLMSALNWNGYEIVSTAPAPRREVEWPTDEQVWDCIRLTFPEKIAEKLSFKRWKDGVDIDYPTHEAMSFAKQLFAMGVALAHPPQPARKADRLDSSDQGGVREDEHIVWRRVNDEPFEYAVQQGDHGDEFVKLLNGVFLRRATSPAPVRAAAEPGAVERFQKRIVEMMQTGCTGFHFTSGPKWHSMTIEEKCAAMLEVWDAKATPLDFKDSRAALYPASANEGDWR